MKKNFILLFAMLVGLFLCANRSAISNIESLDIGDRVRNLPAMSTEREGTSNTIYISTFGLQPARLGGGNPQGMPSKLWKINYENQLNGLSADYDEIVFYDNIYDYLIAYSSSDSSYINSHFSSPENSYRLMGQKGFWASPVLNEDYGYLYMLTKSGMLFSIDVSTMEVDDTAGHYQNLRQLEIQAGANININDYEYMATPLLCSDSSGDYLIIPGIWNVFYVSLSSGKITSTPVIITGMSISNSSDHFVSPAAIDFESDPNIVVISKLGHIFRKIGTTVYSNDYVPGSSDYCYFQPLLSEDGHFYINTESSIYRIPVDGRIAEGAWENEFNVELVSNVTDIENILTSGMEKDFISSANSEYYHKHRPFFNQTIPMELEDNTTVYSSIIHNATNHKYRLMNNHPLFIQKDIDQFAIFSLNNLTLDPTEKYSNEYYYESAMPSDSDIYCEFLQGSKSFPDTAIYIYEELISDFDLLTYGGPAAYYTQSDRINIVFGDEQGFIWTWEYSLAENQIGFSPSYANYLGNLPLYPEYGYSKFMDSPTNVIEYEVLDSVYIHYQYADSLSHRIYLNSFARDTVLDQDFATAYFDKLMKHPKYSLSIFNTDTLAYSADSFRLIDENIHHYYIPTNDTLIVTNSMDITISGGPWFYESITVLDDAILRIDTSGIVETDYINIEEGGLLICSGELNTSHLKLLDHPASEDPAKVVASGYVMADIMAMEDNVAGEFCGYGGTSDYDHNICIVFLEDPQEPQNSILTISHIDSVYSNSDVLMIRDRARFSFIVEGGLILYSFDLFESEYDIITGEQNAVQLYITETGTLISKGCSECRCSVQIDRGGLLENLSGRIRFTNKSDYLKIIHSYGKMKILDDAYLTGNFFDTNAIPSIHHIGGFDLDIYDTGEIYISGTTFCVGDDTENHVHNDGGRIICSGGSAITLQNSGILNITSSEAVAIGHVPQGGILKIDASSNNYAAITGNAISGSGIAGDKLIIERKGEIQGNISFYPRRVSYLKCMRSGSSTYWQGLEINSKIDDSIGNNKFDFINCNFQNMKNFAISTKDTLEINFTNCSFTNNYRALNFIPRKENVGATVEKSNNIKSEVTGCIFYDNYAGIIVQSDSEPEEINEIAVSECDFGKISGSTVSAGNSFGIMSTGDNSKTHINDCDFYDNIYGVYANSTLCQLGNNSTGYNVFQKNDRPVYICATSDTSMISYNTISNSKTNGIYCYQGEFKIEENTIENNSGHGLVALSSVVVDNNFRDNIFEDNNSIEIYASAENIRSLQNGCNLISDDSYTYYNLGTYKLDAWKNYQYFDSQIIAAIGAESMMDVSGNTIPERTDTLRFYPDYDLYDFSGSHRSAYEDGIAAYNAGDYETAIDEFMDHISNYPYLNSSYCALPYLYFSEKNINEDLSNYRQFTSIYLPYTISDTLFYWQQKMLDAGSYLNDEDFSNAIDCYQQVIVFAPSFDDSLQASFLQGYSYMMLTQSQDRQTFDECKIRTATLDEYCEYLLHCMEPDYGTDEIPQVISKVYNYPNPFNPETKICFKLSAPTENLNICIYNIKGQRVWEKDVENLDRGMQEVIWSGRNKNGHQVASGVYLYRIKADNCKHFSKMLMLK